MNTRSDRTERLTEVARLYYEQDQTQNEIAVRLGVSRPLVSRMLREARELGIVEIRIHSPEEGEGPLLTQGRNLYGIRGGLLLPDAADNSRTNRALAEGALRTLMELGGERLGIGWGHLVGVLVDTLEGRNPIRGLAGQICPLVGNSGISIRNYHSNENVRIISQQCGAQPHYLYTPAFAETKQEQELLSQTEHYRAVYREWERLDAALVNIGNYPSTPDFASVARYGTLLAEKRAVGRLLAYYYNERGEIIESETDYAIQIPIPLLARCKNVIGICSANVNRQALAGALSTGLFTHLIAREQLLREVLEYR